MPTPRLTFIPTMSLASLRRRCCHVGSNGLTLRLRPRNPLSPKPSKSSLNAELYTNLYAHTDTYTTYIHTYIYTYIHIYIYIYTYYIYMYGWTHTDKAPQHHTGNRLDRLAWNQDLPNGSQPWPISRSFCTDLGFGVKVRVYLEGQGT